MGGSTFALKGDIVYCTEDAGLVCAADSFAVCEDGRCAGVFSRLPPQYAALPVEDCSGCLVIPGMTDLHVHAPQYAFRGTGMDLELLDWLNSRTFPEEARFADLDYAQESYRSFVGDLASGFTTRACIFATLHPAATLELMRQLEQTGLRTYVGLVCMDRNAPDSLRQPDAASAARDVRAWLEGCSSFVRTRPAITPRFVPSCTDGLMEQLSLLQKEFKLPVQSHLSENPGEVALVRELNPRAGCYGDAYDMFGLFGGGYPAVMAHCVYSSDEEIALMKRNGVFVAHCPESNVNLSSGIAPIRRYLDAGLHVGLGTDVAAGSSLSMPRAVQYAVQVSKLYWRLADSSCRPVSAVEAFFLATLGGGAFFGRTGSFLPGYAFDALVVDDRRIQPRRELPPEVRLERMLYAADERLIVRKYVEGMQITPSR